MAKTKKASKTSRQAKSTKSRKAAAAKTKKKTASPKKKATKKTATKKKAAKMIATAKKSTASVRGEATSRTRKAAEVTMDRRSALRGDQRQTADRREDDRPVEVNHRKLKRREKVNRRRQIDPTTCERDYTPDEVEFMQALDEYKRKSGRMFPTCSEILEVIRGMGYARLPASSPINVNQPMVEPGNAVDTPDSSESLASLV